MNSVVTTDALGCQKKIAEKIIEKQADYVLMVKDNQKNLKIDIEQSFESLKHILTRPKKCLHKTSR